MGGPPERHYAHSFFRAIVPAQSLVRSSEQSGSTDEGQLAEASSPLSREEPVNLAFFDIARDHRERAVSGQAHQRARAPARPVASELLLDRDEERVDRVGSADLDLPASRLVEIKRARKTTPRSSFHTTRAFDDARV